MADITTAIPSYPLTQARPVPVGLDKELPHPGQSADLACALLTQISNVTAQAGAHLSCPEVSSVTPVLQQQRCPLDLQLWQ